MVSENRNELVCSRKRCLSSDAGARHHLRNSAATSLRSCKRRRLTSLQPSPSSPSPSSPSPSSPYSSRSPSPSPFLSSPLPSLFFPSPSSSRSLSSFHPPCPPPSPSQSPSPLPSSFPLLSPSPFPTPRHTPSPVYTTSHSPSPTPSSYGSSSSGLVVDEEWQGGAAQPWDEGRWVVCAPRTPAPPPRSRASAATPSAAPAATPGAPPRDAAPPRLAPGAVLRGAAAAYQVQSALGRGVFGQVFRCREVENGSLRAVKALQLEGHWGSFARNEARALAHISANNPNGHNLLRMFESFQFDGKLMVVVENLDRDLASYMDERGERLRMQSISIILRQIFAALRKLQELDIVHCDIKPDNVMFVDVPLRGLAVKLIDFSCARSSRAAAEVSRTQALGYRAPEVALGQGASFAADVWSVGCVAAELATARPLYPARSEAQLLGAVWRTHGELPAALLERPGRTAEYFWRRQRGGWAPKECKATGDCPSVISLFQIKTDHLVGINEDDDRYVILTHQFGSLLMGLLEGQPEMRISATDAMNHAFFNFDSF